SPAASAASAARDPTPLINTTSDPTPLLDGLRDLGYAEGRDFTVEWRFDDGRPENLPGLARELAQLPVDVLVTVASPAAIAARQATATVPIVFMLVNDPVAQGLVPSLARPGGNITGLSTLSGTQSAKRVEVVHAALADISRLAVLWNTTNP